MVKHRPRRAWRNDFENTGYRATLEMANTAFSFLLLRGFLRIMNCSISQWQWGFCTSAVVGSRVVVSHLLPYPFTVMLCEQRATQCSNQEYCQAHSVGICGMVIWIRASTLSFRTKSQGLRRFWITLQISLRAATEQMSTIKFILTDNFVFFAFLTAP